MYLKSSFEAILQRLQNHPNAVKKLSKRPLFKDLKKAKELYKQRVKEYEKLSDLTITVENKDLKQITNEILSKV